jgi:hypothetical protein
MLLDCDFKVYGIIKDSLINNLKKLCINADWSREEYNRYDNNLITGKLITLPYIVSSVTNNINSLEKQGLIDAAQLICEQVIKIFPNHTIVRGEIATILPGTYLKMHEDGFWFHKKSKRIHVPIYTNDKCKQIIEQRLYHFNEGIIYELNNRIKHSAINSGETSRTHIILDLLSNIEIPENISDEEFLKLLRKPVIRPINYKEVDDLNFPIDPITDQTHFEFNIIWRWRGDRWAESTH